MINILKRSKALRKLHAALSTQAVPVSKLLLGQDNGLNPLGFARVSGDTMWTSTRIQDSPQSQFLKLYESIGDKVLDLQSFRETSFYKHAALNINLVGKYFNATNESEILAVAYDFLSKSRNSHQSIPASQLLAVKPIVDSDCFQVSGDLQSLAIAIHNGKTHFRIQPSRTRVQTALQHLLSSVLWFDGNRELYQPVNAPELQKKWVQTRNCQDRLAMMQSFLHSRSDSLPELSKMTYMDLGSFYGWFVSKMASTGLKCQGIEIDPTAIQVGVACYGLDPKQIHQGDIAKVLAERDPFDVVSCLSVLHHFVLSKQSVSADDLIHLIDKKTRHILFLDTGEEHEGWFGGRLAGWTPDYIEKWVIAKTSFSKAYRLGTDHDARYPHQDCYARTLFAFVR
jgi:hypothetical protein